MSKPTTTDAPTPAPPSWVGQDPALSRLWESSLTWRIEMLRADGHVDRASEIERVTHLAHEHDLVARSTITLAEAERRWRKQNLRGNAKGRLAMWQDQPGSPWLTTVEAMGAVFGDEPS